MTQAALTHLHDAILGARRDYVVVVWAPGDIEDGSFVSANKRMISWDSTYLESDLCV